MYKCACDVVYMTRYFWNRCRSMRIKIILSLCFSSRRMKWKTRASVFCPEGVWCWNAMCSEQLERIPTHPIYNWINGSAYSRGDQVTFLKILRFWNCSMVTVRAITCQIFSVVSCKMSKYHIDLACLFVFLMFINKYSRHDRVNLVASWVFWWTVKSRPCLENSLLAKTIMSCNFVECPMWTSLDP